MTALPYTVTQAANRLSLSAETIRRAIRNGEIEAKLIGSTYAIDRASFEAYKRAKTVPQFSIDVAARRTGYTTAHIQRLIKNGKIEATERNGQPFVDVGELQEYKKNARKRIGSTAPKPTKAQQIVIRPKRKAKGKVYDNIEDAVAAGDPEKAVYIPLKHVPTIRQCDVMWELEDA